MSLIRKHVAVLQAWACLALVFHNDALTMLQFKQFYRFLAYAFILIIVIFDNLLFTKYSVVTQLGCNGIFGNRVITNFLRYRKCQRKDFENRLVFGEDMDKRFAVYFFGSLCIKDGTGVAAHSYPLR